MHIFELVPEEEYWEALSQKLIRVQYHPEKETLAIANYTDKAQVNNIWTRATKTLRGVVFNAVTGQVLARPFPKFFNYGQEPAKHRRWRPNEQAVVTDKLDGSLGILYPFRDGYRIATRGSFASEQALHATNVLRTKYPDFRPPLGKTYLFEIIYPENRIVVDYGGADDLYLIGVVDIETGLTYSPIGDSAASCWGWPGPVVQQAPYVRLSDALAAPPRPGKEGLVVHFVESDERVKIKQADYIALHKIVTGLNEVVVWEALQRNRGYEELIESLPDEFHAWTTEVADRLFQEWFRHDWELESTFTALEDAGVTEDRKAFALSIKDKPAWLKAALFAFLDGNYGRAQEVIWKQIKPKGDK